MIHYLNSDMFFDRLVKTISVFGHNGKLPQANSSVVLETEIQARIIQSGAEYNKAFELVFCIYGVSLVGIACTVCHHILIQCIKG